MHKIIHIDREVLDIKLFWVQNPQLKYISPFSELYNIDTSTDKEVSSRIMYAIVFQLNQDETENIYFSMDKDEQKKQLETNVLYKGFDWNDKLYLKCYEAFPEICLTLLERSILEEKEAIRRRKKLFDQEWTLDTTKIELDKQGQPRSVTVVGTAKQLNILQKDSAKIYEAIEKLVLKYLEEKAEIRGRGDSHIPISDREKMW